MVGPIISGACCLIAATFAVAGGVPNDDCAEAVPIVGEGIFAFDNTAATTDGPPEEEIAHDVWYCWTGPCEGDVTVDTCRGTTVDTKVAVYDGCQCPPTDLLTYDDDTCLYQTSLTFSAVAGQDYLIRIGTNPLVQGGMGTFTVTCGAAPVPPCQQSSDNCQDRDHWNALAGDRDGWFVADNFTPAIDGTISEICWWGTYYDGAGDCQGVAPDAFEVRYYSDDGGVPGTLLAGPFSQVGGMLTIEGPIRTYALLADLDREYEYTATHEPVSVAAGQCYWIEISNMLAGTCSWYWEAASSGDAWASQDGDDVVPPDGYDRRDAIGDDLAFCLDLPLVIPTMCHLAPVNDACADSLSVSEGDTFFDTMGATTDDPGETCFTLGDHYVHRDIWFDYDASCSALLIVSACGSLFDTKLAVYEGAACPSPDPPLVCDDDGCGDDLAQQSQIALLVTQGYDYKIRVGGYDSEPEGDCAFRHDYAGCSEPMCEAEVCAADASCCEVEWDSACAETAHILCGGRCGSGIITLELIAPPPVDHTLADYAEFMVCFTGACDDPLCDPPLYVDPCCLTEDFDKDGDVDLDDYAEFHSALTGP